MRKLKHLPLGQWTDADHEAFRRAYEPGDVFDETAGPGAHLAEGTRKMIRTAWRRWLGFLKEFYPEDLLKAPADRIILDRVCPFIDHLREEVRQTTVAHVVHNLCYAARLIAPERDWEWLASIAARLAALARPQDRFDRLVPPVLILDFGMELMDEALTSPTTNGHKQRETQFRNGLLLSLLSLWLIRRRSITALTVSRHLEFDAAGANMLLYPEDTKSKRADSFRVPKEELLPYLQHYLREIRPRLLGHREHDGFWVSYTGRPLSGDYIYAIVRALMTKKFGKAMGLHDFRRAAATFLAMDAPEKIGLVPGMLQHASPDTGKLYILARSLEASRRFAAHLARARARLRPLSTKDKG
jgi:integrase/recombinase XerD